MYSKLMLLFTFSFTFVGISQISYNFWHQGDFISISHWKRKRVPEKTSISALLTMPKPLTVFSLVQFSSVALSCPTLCDPMNRSLPGLPVHHQLHPNSCPLSRWCHSTISSLVVPFSSCPQSLPASESFPMSQLFTWGGQSTRVSA